jgi:hypothetical protein
VYTLSKEEVSITHRIGLEVSDLPPFRALLRASLKITEQGAYAPWDYHSLSGLAYPFCLKWLKSSSTHSGE